MLMDRIVSFSKSHGDMRRLQKILAEARSPNVSGRRWSPESAPEWADAWNSMTECLDMAEGRMFHNMASQKCCVVSIPCCCEQRLTPGTGKTRTSLCCPVGWRRLSTMLGSTMSSVWEDTTPVSSMPPFWTAKSCCGVCSVRHLLSQKSFGCKWH